MSVLISICIIFIVGLVAGELIDYRCSIKPYFSLVYVLIPIALLAVLIFTMFPFVFSSKARFWSIMTTPIIAIISVAMLLISSVPAVDTLYRKSIIICWIVLLSAYILFRHNIYRIEIMTLIKIIMFSGLFAYMTVIWFDNINDIHIV